MKGSVISGHARSPEGTGTDAQRERRTRILDAAIALASRGGFEAVQMRAVAEDADVALGTLYRYFPSKIHLLVSALAREFERAAAALRDDPVTGASSADRVVLVLGGATRRMQADPHLTEALTRAFMFADASVQAESHAVGRLTTAMLTGAMQNEGQNEGDPSDQDTAIAKVLADVWFSGLVGWVTGRTTADEVVAQIEVAARLLLR
jgi:TetR/AcrR family transcriptional regulator, cholesterol catabolism regulator